MIGVPGVTVRMDTKQMRDLIEHWRILASEARDQGASPTQAPLIRAHAFGLSDGLELAAKDLLKLLEALNGGAGEQDDS